MTTLNLSIFDPSCSWCWNKKRKISNNQILFLLNKDLHWACCKEHETELIKTNKEIYPNIKIKKIRLWKGNPKNLSQEDINSLIIDSLIKKISLKPKQIKTNQ